MVIKFQTTISSITEDFIARCYEVAIDGTEAEISSGGITVPFPHTSPQDVEFTGLDKVIHHVRLFGVTSTIEYAQWPIEPTADIVTTYMAIRFKIGDGQALTPVAGTSAYSNPLLAGVTADEQIITKNGVGVMFEGVRITNDILGGFGLIGNVFSTDEEFTIQRNPTVIQTVVNDSVVGKLFGPTFGAPDMFVDVSSLVNYDPLHLRKLIRFAGPFAQYKFRSTDNIPVGYLFAFNHYGSYTPTSLPFTTSGIFFENAPVKNGNSTLNYIPLSYRATCAFVFDGSYWNIIYLHDGIS